MKRTVKCAHSDDISKCPPCYEAFTGETAPQDNSELYYQPRSFGKTSKQLMEFYIQCRKGVSIAMLTPNCKIYSQKAHDDAIAAEREKILDGLGNIADSYEFEDEHGCKLVNRNHIDGFIASQRRKTE